jgi:phytoene dehydrogenase-like protein
MAYDVVIIGTGMGGLTAGALLAKKGVKVVLLEKGSQPGGYVVSFRRQGFTFDATGVFVGGCEPGGEFDALLKEVDVHLEFKKIDSIRNIYPGFEIALQSGGFDHYIERLKAMFPEEERGIERYEGITSRIGGEVSALSRIKWYHKALFPLFFPNLVRFSGTTHQAVLDALFKGRELKMAMSSLPVTVPPSELSFLFVATFLSKVISQGAYYPKGGMGGISRALAGSIERSGATIRYGSEATRILTRGNEVMGVVTDEGQVIDAPIVISNVSLLQTFRRLLSEGPPSSLVRSLDRLQYSLSNFIVYLGVRGDADINSLPFFTYLRSISDLEEEHRMLRRGEIPENPTVIMAVPSLVDPSLAPEGTHVVKLLSVAPYGYRNRWNRANRQTYQSMKEEIAQRLISHVESRIVPGLKGKILFHEAATPVTLERYTGNEQGAMYGLATTPRQFGRYRPPNRTTIKGLYLAGHYTRPAHGIIGAAISGSFAARMILSELDV